MRLLLRRCDGCPLAPSCPAYREGSRCRRFRLILREVGYARVGALGALWLAVVVMAAVR